MEPDGSMRVNCYNCSFRTTYRGGDITHGFEAWLGWLGAPRDRIQEAKLEILSKKLNGEIETPVAQDWFRPETFQTVDLPDGSMPIEHWLSLEEPPDEFVECMGYLINRGRAISEWHGYHWTPKPSRHDFNRRIIIPFYHQGRIVGYTGRYCGTAPKGVPRYYNGAVPDGFLFNNEVIASRTRKFLLITEGPLDAIAVDGVAALGSTLSRAQTTWINSTDKEKIVVPDRQAKNQELIDAALTNGWSVSFPEWGQGIKDAADASKRYGKLFTLASIIDARTSSHLEIGVKRRMLKG